MSFTVAELRYLRSIGMGRLATISVEGELQNIPVAFLVDEASEVVEIQGRGSALSHVTAEPNGIATLVVDDLIMDECIAVRCLEVRGMVQASPAIPSDPLAKERTVRIQPSRIISWGIDAPYDQELSRDIEV